MKKLFTLITLASVTSVSLVSADQYGQNYGGNWSGSNPSCNNDVGYYQNQPYNANYGQQRWESNPRQNPQGNYQRDDRNYQRNNQYGYQQPRNQSYDQNQQYSQEQGQQPYDRNQQRTYGNNYESQANQNVASDQEISRKIQNTLNSGWFSKGFENVSFAVANGNVNLRGSVNSLEDKNKVEDSVKKIDGVRQVNNQITIVKETPDTYSDSQLQNSEKKYPQDFASNTQDRQLNAKIRDKLSNNWFSKNYDTLVIRTNNGVVTISGNIDKVEDIQKIIDQIRNVDGVKSVNNQLTVKNR